MNPAVGMPCPVCKVALVMSDRQGVEIEGPQGQGDWQFFHHIYKHQQGSHQQRTPQQGQVNPPQYRQPVAAQAGRRFVDAGGYALKRSIKPLF